MAMYHQHFDKILDRLGPAAEGPKTLFGASWPSWAPLRGRLGRLGIAGKWNAGKWIAGKWIAGKWIAGKWIVGKWIIS